MERNYFSYKVITYNEEDYSKRKFYCGIVCAEDYGAAAISVSKHYGTLMIDMTLSEWDVGTNVLELTRETLLEVERDDSIGEDYEEEKGGYKW